MRYLASPALLAGALLLAPAAFSLLLANTPDSVLSSNDGGMQYVTSIGDVNGDGYGDVMVGAHHGFAFLGGSSGIASGGWETAATNLEGYSGGGQNMAGVGDLNGDGYDDVIMGFDYTYAGAGIADVWMGGPSGIETAHHNHIHSGLMSDGYTYGGFRTIASAGDVNGDGYGDVIVTTSRWIAPNQNQREGIAAIFLGSAAVFDAYLYVSSADTLIVFPPGAGNAAGAGDVNGDGYDDVIIGTSGYTFPGTYHEGAAMVFHGSASGIPSGSQPDTLLATKDWGDFNGSVAGAGDVNGDGYDDVIIGSPYLGGGVAILYLGSASGIPESLTYESPTAISIGPDIFSSNISNAFPYFGWSVAGAGDVNGDGYDDVIVGAPYYTNGEQNEGAAFVVLGSETGIAAGATNSAYARIESNQAFGFLGIDVAGAGDVNGDGLADVIVAASGYHADVEGGSSALIYLGQADVDSDRIPDPADNCRTLANPTQLDSDDDGFGNHCDADFDQDGVSGAIDLGTFRRCYGRAVPFVGGPAADPTCAESDMDGDGLVGSVDLGLFRSEYLTPPG